MHQRLFSLITKLILMLCVFSFTSAQEHGMDNEYIIEAPIDTIVFNSAVEIVRQRWQSQSNAAVLPTVLATVHNQNKVQLTLDNRGNVGLGEFFIVPFGRGITIKDPYTGEKITGAVYPKGSGTRFMLQGSMLIGGVVGVDTLVTHTRWETLPEEGALGQFKYLSTDVTDSRFSPDAISDLDITATYTDTFPAFSPGPWFDIRPHVPLGIRVTQRSHTWSAGHLDDFIMIDYTIENISGKNIKDAFVGFYNIGIVQTLNIRVDSTELKFDDAVGFLKSYPAPEGCDLQDTVNIAYAMDIDGDPSGNSWGINASLSAFGVSFLKKPTDNSIINYNWWSYGYGPRLRGTLTEPFRGFLVPFDRFSSNDVTAYYYLSHKEHDYDQLTTWINKSFEGWEPPPSNAAQVTAGGRNYYLVSAGPFNLPPSSTASFTIALVGGSNVHQNPNDYKNFFAFSYPWTFYESLDFSNFALNARWAEWVYDNPGYDTDNDGYFGEYRMCNDDTMWYKGDGVADFRTDGPPQKPFIHVVPSDGKLTIRWNGYYTEQIADPLAGLIDFEGYRVYAALDDRNTSFALLSSYDRENYNRFRFELLSNGDPTWIQEGNPRSLEVYRAEYNDSNFNPLVYTRENPLNIGDEYYFFASQDYNSSDLGSTQGIHKVFPDAPFPGLDPNKWTEDDVIYDYDRPLPKYFEYQYVYDSILPTVPYYVAVTAFDFGSAASGVPSLETKPVDNMIREFPQTSSDSVVAYSLDAYVYPNPYRSDGEYADDGFENRGLTQTKERSRRIYFANLPSVCTIRIFSLDGDLVRELDHNFPDGGPTSQQHSWDLVTRNTQAVKSGLYYYSIESEGRNQIGKFVIIK